MRNTKKKNGASKLTFRDLDEIRCMFEEGMSDSQIAKIKSVSRVHINHIRNGKRWNEENWDEIPKHLVTKEEPKVKSNDFREFTNPKPTILNQYQENQIQTKLEGFEDINNTMSTDEFQTKYHLIKFIEALTGKKPKKVEIMF